MSELPLYPNPPKVREDGSKVSVLYIPDIQPGYKYYGFLSSSGALVPAYLEYRVLSAWLQIMEVGGYPSLIAQFVDAAIAPKKDKVDAFTAQMQDEFAGDGNFARMLTQVLSSKEDFANFFSIKPEFPRDFIDVRSMCRDAIIQAHRCPPVLANILQPGALGNQKERREAYRDYYSTVISPVCQKFEAEINEVMNVTIGGNVLLKQSPPSEDQIPYTNNEVRVRNGLQALDKSNPKGEDIWLPQ
jgi:hypothetical protein